ncbi:MAG TPA: tetratricopeptide repeat protein [Anaerolineales bacterium]|nr:tetratricopeptide repeat protein [Anaerolineales bacterium]
MSKRKAILLLLSIFILIAYSRVNGAGFKASNALPDPGAIDGSGLANVPPVADAIRSVQNRIRQNPRDAVSYTLLGDLYLRQARESGDISAYQRAETALSKAVDLLPGYAPAGSLLASVHYARHDFTQALELAGQVHASNPRNLSARTIMADAYLSLGEYEQAEVIYRELGEANASPPVLARLAHLADLKGNPDQALVLMERAAGEALHSGGTKENTAWYLLRLGDLHFSRGETRASGAYYEASLRVFENYHLALAGLGRVSAAQGKYDEAIAYYRRAVNIVPQPESLAALGDLYMLTGQPGQAKIQYDTVEYIGQLAALNRQVYNRQLANFYSDHDLNLPEALQLALAELQVRRDIHGYDAAAWAYYKNGKFQEAQNMMEQALALGTRDAQLYYHAGMIAVALEDESRARQYLEQALAINPHFSILQAAEARRTLETLPAAVMN